jgi:hypothetical protein
MVYIDQLALLLLAPGWFLTYVTMVAVLVVFWMAELG